jgi:hypothetical protein
MIKLVEKTHGDLRVEFDRIIGAVEAPELPL